MKVHGDYYGTGYAHLEGLTPAPVAHEFLAQLRDDIAHAGFPIQKLVRTAPPLPRPTLQVYGYEHKPLLNFLWGLTPSMCELTQCDLLPSFCYFRAYQAGDVLRVHSDRNSCEHSLSLTLGYSDDKPWAFEISPERIEKAQSIADDFGGKPYSTIMMQPGDAVLYQGVNYRHGRMTSNPNRWSAHIFLHWVDSKGPFKDLAFDGRRAETQLDFTVK